MSAKVSVFVYEGPDTDGASARPKMAAKADATKPRLHFFIILNMAELRKFLKVRKGPLRSDTGLRRRAKSCNSLVVLFGFSFGQSCDVFYSFLEELFEIEF